jgi:hypothetical protein
VTYQAHYYIANGSTLHSGVVTRADLSSLMDTLKEQVSIDFSRPPSDDVEVTIRLRKVLPDAPA